MFTFQKFAVCIFLMVLAAAAQEAKPTAGVLGAAEVRKLVPTNYFYAGQTAPVQMRNSAAARSASGKLAITGLVDASGYSSSIQERYQGFLLTDGTLKFGDHSLPAGAYGIGGLPDGRFIVTDLASREVFTQPLQNDGDLKRPTPLKISADGSRYRLYLGRKYVVFSFGD